VVLPATACSGSTSRTVSLEVGPAASTTVRELKEAIQLRSAQVYGASSSSSSSSWRGEEKEEEEEGLGGIPAALQRLTLGGRHLRDEQTLAECAVVGYVNKAWMDCVCESSAHAGISFIAVICLLLCGGIGTFYLSLSLLFVSLCGRKKRSIPLFSGGPPQAPWRSSLFTDLQQLQCLERMCVPSMCQCVYVLLSPA